MPQGKRVTVIDMQATAGHQGGLDPAKTLEKCRQGGEKVGEAGFRGVLSAGAVVAGFAWGLGQGVVKACGAFSPDDEAAPAEAQAAPAGIPTTVHVGGPAPA